MTYYQDLGIGVNPERLIWSQVEHAIELPSMNQRSSRKLTLTFGRDALGWQLDDSVSRRQMRYGPALSLVAVPAPTVKLTCRQFPQRPALIEREGLDYPTGGLARVGLFDRLFSLFTVDGVIVDAADGKVDFLLTPADMDGAGRFFLEPRVVFDSGEQVVPRLLKLELIPSVS